MEQFLEVCLENVLGYVQAEQFPEGNERIVRQNSEAILRQIQGYQVRRWKCSRVQVVQEVLCHIEIPQCVADLQK